MDEPPQNTDGHVVAVTYIEHRLGKKSDPPVSGVEVIMPPTEFSRLLEETDVPQGMRELIASFLKRKETAGEKVTLNVPKHFVDWVLALDANAEQMAPTLPTSAQPDWEPLNQLFLNTLKE